MNLPDCIGRPSLDDRYVQKPLFSPSAQWSSSEADPFLLRPARRLEKRSGTNTPSSSAVLFVRVWISLMLELKENRLEVWLV